MRTVRDLAGTGAIAGLAMVLAGALERWRAGPEPRNGYQRMVHRVGAWATRVGVVLLIIGVLVALVAAWMA